MVASSTSSKNSLRIAAVIDNLDRVRGAELHFYNLTRKLAETHQVTIFTRSVSNYYDYPESVSKRICGRLRTIAGLREGDFDIVFVMHFKTVWVLPFISQPKVLYVLEPPRAYNEPWIIKNKPFWRTVLIRGQGIIDRFIVKRYADHIVGNSAYTLEVVYRAYGKFGHYVYPGVDETIFFRSPESVDRRHVIFVGSTDTIKQPLMAIAGLATLHPDLRPPLLIVGPYLQEVQDVADKYEVEIDWVEGASASDLRAYYQSAHCTLCTSVMEPYGLTAAESIACGTPVVAIDEGGFREIVTPCCGARVPRNMHALAEGIARCILDPPPQVTLPDSHYLSHTVDKFEGVLRGILEAKEAKA